MSSQENQIAIQMNIQSLQVKIQLQVKQTDTLEQIINQIKDQLYSNQTFPKYWTFYHQNKQLHPNKSLNQLLDQKTLQKQLISIQAKAVCEKQSKNQFSSNQKFRSSNYQENNNKLNPNQSQKLELSITDKNRQNFDFSFNPKKLQQQKSLKAQLNVYRQTFKNQDEEKANSNQLNQQFEKKKKFKDQNAIVQQLNQESNNHINRNNLDKIQRKKVNNQVLQINIMDKQDMKFLFKKKQKFKKNKQKYEKCENKAKREKSLLSHLEYQITVLYHDGQRQFKQILIKQLNQNKSLTNALIKQSQDNCTLPRIDQFDFVFQINDKVIDKQIMKCKLKDLPLSFKKKINQNLFQIKIKIDRNYPGG